MDFDTWTPGHVNIFCVFAVLIMCFQYPPYRVGAVHNWPISCRRTLYGCKAAGKKDNFADVWDHI